MTDAGGYIGECQRDAEEAKQGMIQFFVPGIPKAQPRPRAFARKMGGKFVARVYDAGTAEGWKSAIAEAAKAKLPESPMEGPLSLNVLFVMPRPQSHYRRSGRQLKPDAPMYPEGKPDLDNMVKAVKDALTTLGMWRDDCLIVRETLVKVYGDRPGAEISIDVVATA